MRFTITGSLDNAAFAEPGELARILEGVAARIDRATELGLTDRGKLTDLNGNTVGEWVLR